MKVTASARSDFIWLGVAIRRILGPWSWLTSPFRARMVSNALSKGTFAIDNTTSKSFKIISAGRKKKVGGLRKAEENYFQRAGYKLREYKIRGGRAFKIAPKYIERTRYGIDTRGEKRGLSIARYLKEQRTGVIHHKRKISPVQRRIMLKSLAKARKVLARRKR